MLFKVQSRIFSPHDATLSTIVYHRLPTPHPSAQQAGPPALPATCQASQLPQSFQPAILNLSR